MSRLSNRRFVVSSIQRRLLVGIGLYLMAIFLAFLAASVAPLPFSLDEPSVSPDARDQRAFALLALEKWVWIGACMLGAVCVIHSVIVSNRIAGPLHRMKDVLGRLGDGDLSFRMQIRPSDYLWEEVEALNRMIASLASRTQFIRESYRDVRESLSHLEEAIAAGDEREIKVICGQMQTRLDRLGERVNEIRTVGAPLEVNGSADQHEPSPIRQTARAAQAVQGLAHDDPADHPDDAARDGSRSVNEPVHAVSPASGESDHPGR